MKYYFSNLAIICIFLSFSIANSQISFENEAVQLGLNFTCGDTYLGNGVTFFDFNDDGWDDLTFATGENQSLRFFKNENGTFQEYFFNMPDYDYATKCVNWVDYDNDGDKDLYVTSFTDGNKLLRNDGNDNFVDATVIAGLPLSNIFTYGASWGDIDNDGNLDVFLSSFDSAKTVPNYLFRNNGNGTFTNISQSAGISSVGHLSFCSAFFDYNNDGWQDIYISNDRALNPNILYKNNGDATFTDVSEISGADVEIDAMSVTIDDFNSDGWFDIYVTNTVIEGNYFLKNNGNGTFTNIAESTDTQVFGTCWGAVFLDAENDTDLDLYVSSSQTGTTFSSSKFFRNLGFETYVSSNTNFYGFENDAKESHSNAIGDINNDGLLDIVVGNVDFGVVDFWKNNTETSNNWLKVKLEGSSSNKDGIGSIIEISINGDKQYRYTLCGEGYLSQNSATEVFGLGSSETVDYIKVKWLSGLEDILYDIEANQTINIIEGSTLSTNDFEVSNLKIYPNPVTDVLYIINSNNSNPVGFRLYDLTGKLLIESQTERNNIDFSNFNSGVYIIEVSLIDKPQESEYFKIIKE